MRPYKTKQGNWQVSYTHDGVQRTLYLGRHYTAVSVDRVARIITELVVHRNRGDDPPPDLLRNVGTLPARIQSSLERFGLIRCCFGLSLGDLCERFMQAKSHLKKSTLAAYAVSRKRLIRHFGYDRSISTIGVIGAGQFVGELSKSLADCTISRDYRQYRTIFRFAVDQGFLTVNPFSFKMERLDCNEERMFYVEPAVIEKTLQKCRDDRERLAIALGRFGGLRIPSELFGMRFGDFTGDVVRIANDTKTGWREVPVFSMVRNIFDRLTGKPDELIFGGIGKAWARCVFLRALSAAGVPAWEKLWVNMRSSCITDFVRMGYDEKTLDAIFGNTAKVRRMHYVQFDKERSYRRVLSDAERIFSAAGQDAAVLQELLPLLREFLSGRH